eukprot:SAG31_NODE_682_length_12841_cov_13.637655_6_plen_118_part_00
MLISRNMEFHSRKACIEYFDAQYPHLPRYMIEMAYDYEEAQSKKKMTGSERRALKRVSTSEKSERLTLTPGVSYGTAQVVSANEYTMPPMIQGTIEVDGAKLMESLETSEKEAVELL